MKPQDALFLLLYAGIIVWRKFSWLVAIGIMCLILAIPLYAKWIFFTAERLVWYAAAFFLTYIIYIMQQSKRR
jgi:hypothetical protein